jgi:hypothetical protein
MMVTVVAIAIAGCEGTESTRIDPAVVPSGPEFRPVAQVLVDRCGSSDCHGSKYRNMRLFGLGSVRIDVTHRPDAPETTDEESDRNYDAVVALEPDLLRQVVAEGGARPERLTFIRKARGAEAHKGGQRIVPGDAADGCVRSWLAGAVDAEGCRAAVPRLAEP